MESITPDVESLSSENASENLPIVEDDDDSSPSVVFQSASPYPRPQSEIDANAPPPPEGGERKKKKGGKCINGSLLALKLLLFIFYGGIGTISSWLNHTQFSARFNERESLLVYGLSALLSFLTPVIFGLISDKTAQPKKVLGICLVLAGLLYPLILAVPPAEPYRYAERLKWCKDTIERENSNKSGVKSLLGNAFTSASCVPNRLSCTAKETELISDYGGCSEGCNGKIIISACHFRCNDSMRALETQSFDYEDDEVPVAAAQKQILDEDEQERATRLASAPPHLCVHDNPHFKYKNLCFAFDKDMHEIPIEAGGISGYVDHDGKCHYPLVGYSSSTGEKTNLLSCSPLSSHCHVSCDLRWDTSGVEGDQWTCHSDFVQWAISLSSFVGIHTLATMLVISAAGLLNSAILSMSHEHAGYFGCQYTYAALGYALVPPGTVLLFEFLHATIDIPWNLEYLVAYCIWLVVCGFLVSLLSYHAEWQPKPKTAGPMLRRWSVRGHTGLFFLLLVILGSFQCLSDVLSFHQIKSVGGSLLIVGVGAAVAVGPLLIFSFRVERFIDYCGYQNIFFIALILMGLQFAGYAYLEGVDPLWSFMLKGIESFSIIMVWISAAYTTYAAGPRSLSATCQTIIATFYCSIGRGVGGLLGFIGLGLLEKVVLLKVLAWAAVLICIFFLILHNCCLKPFPYNKQYDYDRPASTAPSGRYTPLKLITNSGKKEKERRNLAKDEELDDKDIIAAS